MPRRPLLVAVLAGSAFAVLAVAVVTQVRWLHDVDAAISATAYRSAIAHPAWRAVMGAVTTTGRTVVIAALAVMACVALVAVRRWCAALLIAAALPTTLALRLILVTVIARPRPADRLAAAGGWAFPSGHTTASATAALLAVLVVWPSARTATRRVLLIGAAATWAAAVGVSRVALVVHWPSDVLGGWLLSVASVTAVAAVVGRVSHRRRVIATA